MSDESPPTSEAAIPEDQMILMMGYLDGELDAEEEAGFRSLLDQSPALRRELVRYRRLADVANAVQLREPADQEWDRFHRELFQRIEKRAGGMLLIGGLVLFVGAGLIEMWRREVLPPLVLGGLTAVVVGLPLLFTHTLRGRLRNLPYDKYREVKS